MPRKGNDSTGTNTRLLIIGVVSAIVIVIVIIVLVVVFRKKNNNMASEYSSPSDSSSASSSQSIENFNINNDEYKIDGNSVLSSSGLGASVVSSNLTSLGTLSSLSVLSPITGYTSNVVPSEGQIGYIKNGDDVARSTGISNGTVLNIMSITLTTGTYIIYGIYIPEARGASETLNTITNLRIGIQESATTVSNTNNNNVVTCIPYSFTIWTGHATYPTEVSISTAVNVVGTKTFYLNVWANVTLEQTTTCRSSKFYAVRIA
jgi:hypothetical protein